MNARETAEQNKGKNNKILFFPRLKACSCKPATRGRNYCFFGVWGLLLVLALGFASSAFAQLPEGASIDLTVQKTQYSVKPGEAFELKFELQNAVDDDASIEIVDVYLLDLEKHGFQVVHYSPLWNFEHFVGFQDEHFWIENASSQELAVTLRAVEDIEAGEKQLRGFYNFMDSDNLQWGLQDNKAIKPLNDEVNHVFATVIVKVEEPEPKPTEPLEPEPQQPSQPSTPTAPTTTPQTPTQTPTTPTTTPQTPSPTPLPDSTQQGADGSEVSEGNGEQQQAGQQEEQGKSISSMLKAEVLKTEEEDSEKSLLRWVLSAFLAFFT